MPMTEEEGTFHYDGVSVKNPYGQQGCDSVKVTFDSSITSIGKLAFFGCGSLQSIDIPSHITFIGDYAFTGCSSLETVIIPSSVRTIGREAFSGCSNLKSAVIPTNVKSIRRYVFDCCRNLNDESKQSLINRITPTFHEKDFQKGEGAKLGFKGKPQKGWGPEWWGITLDQMEDVMSHPDIGYLTTMREVVEILIKPATKRLGVGYALLMNQHKPLHADIMVSHAWDENIGQFIECLRRSGIKGPFWVCAFSIYQSEGGDDVPTIGDQFGPDPSYGPFSTVLK